MKTNTDEKIIQFINENGQARPHDIGRGIGIGQVALHRQLKKLVNQGKIEKVGRPPLVFYTISKANFSNADKEKTPVMNVNIYKYIEGNYLYINPQGEILYGMEGFRSLAALKRKEITLASLAEKYVNSHKRAESVRTSNGWIDATEKMKITFTDNALTKLLYADFYSISEFGKTKLGNLVLYAKQSQNRDLIDVVAKEVKPLIEGIIKYYSIDTAGFIPPSIPRRTQFMQELEKGLALNIPTIQLVKTYKGEVIVAQKTLPNIEERITNARETIFPKYQISEKIKNALLIDDAVGSAATLNETAKKIFAGNPRIKNIIGFAIVGSLKGFEIVREV